MPSITKKYQHVAKDQYEIDQQGWKSFNSVTTDQLHNFNCEVDLL